MSGHYSVPEESELIGSANAHPIGHPISASTKRGFNRRREGGEDAEVLPPSVGVSGGGGEGNRSDLPSTAHARKLGAPLFFMLRSNSRLADSSVMPACWHIPAVGVGHLRSAASESCPRLCSGCDDPLWSVATGVGQGCEDEQSLPPMRGSDIGRSDTTPFRIEPERGKRVEDGAECPPAAGGEEPRDILQENESWFDF